MGRPLPPAVPKIAALLFALWVGYLAYLAWTARDPVVLSRPQLLVAPLVVLADVPADGTPAAVRHVAHAAAGTTPPAEGAAVDVINLGPKTEGWTGPGRYILPLAPVNGTPSYRVPEIPRSPGYFGGPPRVYPATPAAERSLPRLLVDLHR